MTCDQERFEHDVAQHKMSMIREDGVNRHLTFRKPSSSSYWFDIITWPGHLCINGDCGTYVFRRDHDMLTFFRADKYKGQEEGRLYTNPRYWTEKLVAADSNGSHVSGVEELDVSGFKQMVMERIDEYMEVKEGCPFGRELVTEVKRELRSEVFCDLSDNTPINEAHRRVYEFSFIDPKDNETHHPFQDIESIPKNYTFHTMWSLYAIAWAIKQYDAAKAVEKLQPVGSDIPPDVIAAFDRTDWTQEEALRWYAAGKHFDTVNGRTRILDTGSIASNALKRTSPEYHAMKGADASFPAPTVQGGEAAMTPVLKKLRDALAPFANLASTNMSWALVEYAVKDDPERQTFQRPQMQGAFNRAAKVYAETTAKELFGAIAPLTDHEVSHD